MTNSYEQFPFPLQREWLFGDKYRQKERKILSSLGYHLLCADVKNDDKAFEDWWIYPSAFPIQVLSKLKSLDLNEKEHHQILKTLKSLF